MEVGAKMKNDIDDELYKKYLLGDKESFDLLYDKYKDKIKYYIYNIVKDMSEAEDITQEVFMYIMKNEIKDNYSFKHHIYLVARSRAINYINISNRRNELNTNLYTDAIELQNSVLDEIIDRESNNQILSSINMLEDKYKNVIYLVYIENMSYKDVAEIIGESIANTKNLIHRGKIKLYKILLKKGIKSVDKKLKIFVFILIIIAFLSGSFYAASAVYKYVKKYAASQEVIINPTFEGVLDEKKANNLWVGTLDIAWKKLKETLRVDKIELEREFDTVNKLNESKFNEEMLSKDDYNVNVKQNELDGFLTNGFTIEAKLNKNLTFPGKFSNFNNSYEKLTFGAGEKIIKYFGINNSGQGSQNVEVLFHNSDSDFAVKLKTNEEDEIFLYRTDETKIFNDYYNDMMSKYKSYAGSNKFEPMGDELKIPYIKLNGVISYNELLGVSIKNSPFYISKMIQDVDFELNESGCNLSSNVTLVVTYLGGHSGRRFYFTDTFILFMKEKDKEMPYFSLKVDSDDILEKIEVNTELKIIDFTEVEKERFNYVEQVETKFFEDDQYEYYFESKKLPYVYVQYENGYMQQVNLALKEGKINIELLDKFNIKYIKKSKI